MARSHLYGSSVMPAANTVEAAPTTLAARLRRRRLGIVLVVMAVAVIAVAFVVGVMGLVANPVRSVNANGTTTLQGSFEPYQCGSSACDGYIQAGARSVFVQFPRGCPVPERGAQVTVMARPAPDLGNGSYRATACV